MNEPARCPKCYGILGTYQDSGVLQLKHARRRARVLEGTVELLCGRWLEERAAYCDGTTLVQVRGTARVTVVA